MSSETEEPSAGAVPIPEPGAGESLDGVRLGIDVGSVRVGLALSDPRGVLAHPERTLEPDDLGSVEQLIAAHAVVRVYVGLPRTLRGDEGPAAHAARSYAQNLASRITPVPVRLVDERLTTVSAHRQLASSGMRERGRRFVVDQAAAVLILQGALDEESASGRPAGELIGRRRKTRHARRRKEHE